MAHRGAAARRLGEKFAKRLSDAPQVIIVGAGVSGLYAARLLTAAKCKVTVVEASDYVGGRVVCTEPGEFAPWPVPLGAEFIHGRNILTDLAKKHKWKLALRGWPDHFFMNGNLVSGKDAEAADKEGFAKLDEIMDVLEDEESDVEESTLEKHLISRGLPERMLPIADVIYAHDMAASLSQLGMRESIAEARAWTYGEDEYFLFEGGWDVLLKWLQKDIDVRTKWQAVGIDYSGDRVRVRNANGETLEGDRVIITVPLPVIRDGDIAFSPPLPREKISAAKSISFGNVFKIILRFSRRFWPEGLFDVACPGAMVPELWMIKYPGATSDGAAVDGCHIITGYISGPSADALKGKSDAELVDSFLAQLDTMFGEGGRACLVDSIVHDWSKEPFVRGAFTFPTIGALSGQRARSVLGAPVNGKLFFCGEATHPGCNNCTHGAMETSVRAVGEVVASLGKRVH